VSQRSYDIMNKKIYSMRPILTCSGFGSKILCIKDFAPTGNQAGHENCAFSICTGIRKQFRTVHNNLRFHFEQNIFGKKKLLDKAVFPEHLTPWRKFVSQEQQQWLYARKKFKTFATGDPISYAVKHIFAMYINSCLTVQSR